MMEIPPTNQDRLSQSIQLNAFHFLGHFSNSIARLSLRLVLHLTLAFTLLHFLISYLQPLRPSISLQPCSNSFISAALLQAKIRRRDAK